MIRNKQRLIHLYRYLMNRTDEEHQATTNDLVEILRQEDANASRKTVKDDIEILIEEGIDIVVTKSFFNSYFVGSRQFEIPEIQLLVDGIIPNKTLSRSKKEAIIEKLLSLASVYQAEKIRKNLHFVNCSGSKCEQLYYNIDRITDAINDGKKISFTYCPPSAAAHGDVSGEKKPAVTPVEIISKKERYYLLGYCSEEKKFVVFHADYISRIKVLAEKRDPIPSDEEIARFLSSLFDMEMGTLTDVTIEYSADLSKMIKERFGERTITWRNTKDSLYIKVPVSVSPSFYGWVFHYSPDVRIVGPSWVKDEYIKKAKEALNVSEG